MPDGDSPESGVTDPEFDPGTGGGGERLAA